MRADVVAGLTTAAVVIPKAMAYAAIAGLPLEIGLYTAAIPLAAYAAAGTSRVLSVTTTSTLAVLTAGALAPLAGSGNTAQLPAAAAALALMAGATLLLASALRLGFVADFISAPVLTGFKAGIAIVIIVDQLPKMLGIHVDNAHVLQRAASTMQQLPELSLPTVALGLTILAVIVALEKYAPSAPAPLAAIALAIVIATAGDLERRGVALVGAIQGGLPAPQLPTLDLVRVLWPAALGIALMSFVETIAAGRAFVAPGDRLPSPNRELMALGLANAAGSVFTNMPSGGGTSQTAVNSAAGARSQWSGIVTAFAVLATLLFLYPIVALLPHAALAAVVIATTAGLFRPSEFAAIRAVRTREFRWAVAALAGVVLLGTLNGILVAVAISVLTLMYQVNHPRVYELPAVPGMLVLRSEGRIYFANARRLGDEMWARVHASRPSVLALEMSAVPDLEYTALKATIEAETKLREAGITLWLVAVNADVREVIRRSPLEQVLEHRIYPTVAAAIAAFVDSSSPRVAEMVPAGRERR